ncbi:FtsQ-type POTRA domain-containing protein [Sphingomonas sp. XMGL2]|uniref:Cell division protein FtsQ n=2 Tax=Sphingomonas quercus TaxID=2842451 RepID=A0ABS6BJZ2_9SPHN|nr:FtsQ-type POTRA domain-containing protein [Sphingomonas quercus]
MKTGLRWLGVVGAVVLAGVGLGYAGVPAMAGHALGDALGAAGLVVKRVEITGLKHMDRLTVYSAALDQETMAMPLVDLSAIREKLLRYGWIADARVSRRLPDTLLVDIVERTPAAIWQNQGKLMLVDGGGVPLEPVRFDHMPDLPLVVGPDANMQVAALTRLIQAAPSLKAMWSGATWVGGRRWDVHFQSGETLALPEGEAEAHAAITKFARMDQAASLLGRGFLRFDMRVPGKIYARTAAEPGKVAAPIAPPASEAPPIPPPGATAPRDAT